MYRQKIILTILVITSLLLAGCANRAPLPSAAQLTGELYSGAIIQSDLTLGDVISISFLASAHQTDSPYNMTMGDLLRIDVFDHPELSRDRVVVLPDGFVSLPMVGRIQAAGRTTEELQNELVDLYIDGDIVSPEVVVSVEESNDPLIPLLNLVNRNGQHQPLQYIVGHSEYLDLPFIDPVDVRSSYSELQNQIKQRYGDLFGPRLHVVVQLEKSAPPAVYVIGEVVNPGPVDYSEPFNPLMAIAAAGGFRPTAESEDVRLFRRHADNTFDNWSINLENRLERGEAGGDQIPIVPLDVIYVPRSGIAEANRVVEQYIRNMMPIQFVVGGQVIND